MVNKRSNVTAHGMTAPRMIWSDMQSDREPLLRTVTIYVAEEMYHDAETEQDLPRGDDLYTVEDDGGDFDDVEQIPDSDIDDEVEHRAVHYRSLGHEVVIQWL